MKHTLFFAGTERRLDISHRAGEKPNCINIPSLCLGFEEWGKNEKRQIMLSRH